MKPSQVSVEMRIALYYLLFGGLWIIVTDRFLEWLVPDPAVLTTFQTYKGWVFVAASAVFLFFLLRHYISLLKLTHSALLENEERYRLLVNTSHEAILVLTVEGRITAVNPSACQMLNRSESELLSMDIWEIFDATDSQYQSTMADRANLRRFSGELTLLRKDGVRFDGEISSALFTDRQGAEQISLIIRDITDRKKLESELVESRDRLYRILDGITDAFIFVDRDWRITYINSEAARINKKTPEQFLGKTHWEEWPASVGTNVEFQYRKAMKDRASIHFEHRYVDDGQYDVWLDIHVYPNEDGLAIYYRDITDKRMAEEALKESQEQLQQLNAELEQRVAERTEQLHMMNEELEAFTYSVSHDLRAPLRALTGFSDLLLTDQSTNINEESKHFLDRIQQSAMQMNQLIDALLDLSRITRKELVVQPVDLSSLAHEIVAELQSQDPERRVETNIADHLLVMGDLHLLRIVMQNLLSNAWKYSSVRSVAIIEVGVVAAPPNEDADLLESPIYFVRDNGVGFDMTYADKLFAPFQRLHNMKDFPGTGIGLATVQRIILRHGGRIWAEANVNQGATFYFKL